MSHTAKLKRKAAEVESNLDESFVIVGTALPALSSTKKDSNEFLPVWQQEVRDEQGRRRLHGAFTGGFSAGYFNTAGSKEGWKPAEFKSSRTEKGKARESRPEDFMDEEDLAELKGAREMTTHASFAAGAAASAVSQQSYDPFAHLGTGTSDAPPPGGGLGTRAEAAFADLVKPSGGRAGERIMRQMGWREGQGVGPRVTRKRRAQIARELGLQMAEDEDDTEEAAKHLYAPIDRPLALFEARTGLAGLGYSHSSSLPQGHTGAHTGAARQQGIEVDGKFMPRGASFGLGALNDVEDDDEDPYSTRSFITDPRARRLLEEQRPSTRFGAESTVRLSPPPPSSTFADGKPVVRGFRLSGATKDKQPWFAAPEPPRGWEPNPKAMWDRIKKAQMGALNQHTPEGQKLNSMERGRILGEEPIKAPPRSVFDFLSAKDKARLEALRASGGKPSAVAPDRDREPEASLVVPHLDASVARSALQGFIPFGHDPSKQARYRLYLRAQAHALPAGTVFQPKPAPGQRVEQVNAELESFAQSAMMFKPMSAAMASRFTSAGSSAAAGDPPAPEPGLRKPVFEPEPTPEEKAAREAEAKRKEEEEREAQLGPAAQAVRLGMFGRLTRTETPFYPVRLLCKRFNVPDPHPGGPQVEIGADGAARLGGRGSKADDALVAHGYRAAKPASPPPPAALPANAESDEQRAGWTSKGEAAYDGPPKPLGQVGLGDDETQGRDTLTTKRPPMDLFKVIFANSDDEDDGVEAEESAERAPAVGAALRTSVPTPLGPPLRPPPQAAALTGPTLGDTIAFSSVPTVVSADSAALLGSFRPTFSRKGEGAADPAKAKKSKKGKKRAITSFADEEEPAEDELAVAKEKARKPKPKGERPAAKKNKREAAQMEDEEMVWVEKEVAPPPPVATTIAPRTSATSLPFGASNAARARPKAADFLD